MPEKTISTPARVVALQGDVITVHMRLHTSAPTTLTFSIERNGLKEDTFSLNEMTQILSRATQLLTELRAGRPASQVGP